MPPDALTNQNPDTVVTQVCQQVEWGILTCVQLQAPWDDYLIRLRLEGVKSYRQARVPEHFDQFRAVLQHLPHGDSLFGGGHQLLVLRIPLQERPAAVFQQEVVLHGSLKEGIPFLALRYGQDTALEILKQALDQMLPQGCLVLRLLVPLGSSLG